MDKHLKFKLNKFFSCLIITFFPKFLNREFAFQDDDSRITADVKKTLKLFNALYAHVQEKKELCVHRSLLYTSQGVPGLLKNFVKKALDIINPESSQKITRITQYSRKDFKKLISKKTTDKKENKKV